MAASIKFSTKATGPFFELKGLPLKDAGAATIQELLKEGEAKVEQQLTVGHGVRTGQFKSAVKSAFHRRSPAVVGWGSIGGASFLGVPHTNYYGYGPSPNIPTAIVGYWLEGASRKGHATRFKGYFMFRKATQHLRRLARQMAGKHYARAVQRLT